MIGQAWHAKQCARGHGPGVRIGCRRGRLSSLRIRGTCKRHEAFHGERWFKRNKQDSRKELPCGRPEQPRAKRCSGTKKQQTSGHLPRSSFPGGERSSTPLPWLLLFQATLHARRHSQTKWRSAFLRIRQSALTICRPSALSLHSNGRSLRLRSTSSKLLSLPNWT